MSYLLGNPAHQCYVYPDFDKALEKFIAAGIGPFYVPEEVGVVCHYRGEQHPFRCQVAFTYSGESCIEINTPFNGAGLSAFYADLLSRSPNGGLHHIAYYSDDFDTTLAMMERRASRCARSSTRAMLSAACRSRSSASRSGWKTRFYTS